VTIKLLAIDLDGTIVGPGLQISEPVLKALNHAMIDKNVKVVVATGRMHQSALPFAQTIGTPEPVVSYQGGMIRAQNNGNKPLYHMPIDIETSRQVMTLLLEENINANLYMNDVLYVNPQNTFAVEYAKLAGVQPTVVEDILLQLTHAPTKIVAITDTEIDRISALLRERFSKDLGICLSRHNFCELINPATSKWHAVAHLAETYGITPDEIMTIGDQENDIQMLAHAGVGVAMGNAPDAVKAHAKYVTDSIHDDGVKTAIERFILDGEAP